MPPEYPLPVLIQCQTGNWTVEPSARRMQLEFRLLSPTVAFFLKHAVHQGLN